ncbi:unnamed protein product, partial [Didymodactylos carnosus]
MTFGGSEDVIRNQLVELNLNMYNKVKNKFYFQASSSNPSVEQRVENPSSLMDSSTIILNQTLSAPPQENANTVLSYSIVDS